MESYFWSKVMNTGYGTASDGVGWGFDFNSGVFYDSIASSMGILVS